MRVKGGASGHSRLLRRRPPNAQARCTWLVDDPSASQADFILPGARVTERLVDPGSLLLLTFRATSRDRHLPHRCACSLGLGGTDQQTSPIAGGGAPPTLSLRQAARAVTLPQRPILRRTHSLANVYELIGYQPSKRQRLTLERGVGKRRPPEQQRS